MEISKRMFVFGKTGSGKSTFLNILLGSSEDNDGPFDIGDGPDSCTNECTLQEGYLFNDQNNGKIQVIDMPGMFDTKDEKNKTKESFNILKKLETFLNEKWQMELNRIFICIKYDDRLTEEIKNVIEAALIFSNDKQRLAIVITKCNFIKKGKLNSYVNQWTEAFKTAPKNNPIEKIYFFGEEKICMHGNFIDDLKSSKQSKIKIWNALTLNEKAIIRQYFNRDAGCFSLDMQVLLNNGLSESPTSLQIPSKLFGSQFLGFVHYNEDTLTSFYCFHFSNYHKTLECTQNHLVFCLKNRQQPGQFVPANQIQCGDSLIQIGNAVKQELIVNSINIIIKRGFWCPVTNTGQLIVNDILVSCYDTSSYTQAGQTLAHLAMKPLIIYRQLYFGLCGKNKQEPISKVWSLGVVFTFKLTENLE